MATKSLELNVLFDEITESGNKGTFTLQPLKEGMVPQLGMHLEGFF